jgi:hypothetical protein
MGKVTSLADFRNKRPKLKIGIQTQEEAFAEASEGLFSMWMFHSEQDSLNAFISERLEEKDWLNDRNAIAEMESSIPFEYSIMSPGYTFDNLLGWKASFVWSGETKFETPVLASETRARVYCVLLYLTLLETASEVQGHKT